MTPSTNRFMVAKWVANLCIEIIEEAAITASSTPIEVWKRFVADSFVIIKKHSVVSFHGTVNSIDPKIVFNIKSEKKGQLPFLHTLVTDALKSNSYPQSVITNILKKKARPPTTPSATGMVWLIGVIGGSLPYIKGLTEPLSRLIRNNGIQSTIRPLKRLQQWFVSPKSRPPAELQTIFFTSSNAPTVREALLERPDDAYKQGKKNILETLKPFKKVPALLHMLGWTTIPLTLIVHAWPTREISALEKLWNCGIQQLRTTLTIMRNNY